MLFKIAKTDDWNLFDIELDIYQEARNNGTSKPPSITFYDYDEQSYIVDTEPFMAILMKEDYKAEAFNLEDGQSLGEEISSKMETVYKKFENGLFKNKASKKPLRSLPQKVYQTLELQNNELMLNLTENTTLQDKIEMHTCKVIEEDSKLTWTLEETDRGKAYLLQYRTTNLRILVKLAENNFGNMFVKTRFPPTGLELKAFQAKCEKLKFQLFGSILRGNENGLIDFYNKIILEFE